MSSVVNPASSVFNPSYSKGIPTNGANSIIISETQIPAHTHTATAVSTVTEPNSGQGHNHTAVTREANTAGSSFAMAAGGNTSSATIAYSVTGITVDTTVTNASTGGGQPFSIVQPAVGAVYIIYIP